MTYDSPSGDVVLREEPYAACLEAIFRVNHCAHCLKKTPTPIPCYECATVEHFALDPRADGALVVAGAILQRAMPRARMGRVPPRGMWHSWLPGAVQILGKNAPLGFEVSQDVLC